MVKFNVVFRVMTSPYIPLLTSSALWAPSPKEKGKGVFFIFLRGILPSEISKII